MRYAFQQGFEGFILRGAGRLAGLDGANVRVPRTGTEFNVYSAKVASLVVLA